MGNVLVVGQGYVGLPLSVHAAEAGHRVVGLEVDLTRYDSLSRSISYVEDVPSERLAALASAGRYRPARSYQDAGPFDVAVVTVPTPLRDRSPDMSYIEQSMESLGGLVRPGCCVVLESTTYPGTTEDLVVPLLERGSGLRVGADFHVGYSPERIDPGNDRFTLASTPKVVSGVDEKSLAVVRNFYATFVERVVCVSSPRAAELTKLLENTFRHVNIALVNELAIFARELGVDVWEVVEAASTKPFGFMRFTPGPGVGGHCLPIDPAYLSWRVEQVTGRSFRFVEVANDINEHMPDYVVQRVALGLNSVSRSVRGSRVLLVGLAYKKNSSDARESPALRVAELLEGLGAEVLAVDPHVTVDMVGTTKLVDMDVAAVREADAVVVLTDHDDVDLALLARHARWILDTRHCLAGDNVEFL